MKIINWDDLTSCADILRAAEQEDVVLMRDGHSVALVTPFDDNDLEWYAREQDPAFIASIERARQQIAGGSKVSHQKLKAELGID